MLPIMFLLHSAEKQLPENIARAITKRDSISRSSCFYEKYKSNGFEIIVWFIPAINL